MDGQRHDVVRLEVLKDPVLRPGTLPNSPGSRDFIIVEWFLTSPSRGPKSSSQDPLDPPPTFEIPVKPRRCC